MKEFRQKPPAKTLSKATFIPILPPYQQRMVDPRVDILRADWSPFSPPDWTMPLLASLTDWRRRLVEIRSEFRRASAEVEERPPWVVFAADFPGLSLGNFVHSGIDKVRFSSYGTIRVHL